jgi:hypothetical protein
MTVTVRAAGNLVAGETAKYRTTDDAANAAVCNRTTDHTARDATDHRTSNVVVSAARVSAGSRNRGSDCEGRDRSRAEKFPEHVRLLCKAPLGHRNENAELPEMFRNGGNPERFSARFGAVRVNSFRRNHSVCPARIPCYQDNRRDT